MPPQPPTVLRYVRAAIGPDADGPTDAVLLARFGTTRDEGAFELLVWRHAGMVMRVCRGVVRDHHAAEDATQAVFLALARQARAVGRRGTVAGWLYRVARRVSARMANRLRKGLPGPPVDLDQLPAAIPDPDTVTHPDLARLLHDEVDRLPEKYRAAVVLCFFEGLTHADAARRLGWPVGTLSTRLTRAKNLLHRRLTGRGVVVPAAGLAIAPVVAAPAFAAVTTRAAVAFAAGGAVPGVSDTVIELAKGAFRTMTATKLQWAAGLLAACGVITAGGVWAAGQIPGGPGGAPPAIGTAQPAPAIGPPFGDSGPADRRATAAEEQRSLKNLRQIMRAIEEYYKAHELFPADVRDKSGKPLLSWRVLILPYLGQRALFDQFKLDQPWDSEHNLRLLAKLPDVYRVGVEPDGATHTYYQGFAGPNTLFDPSAWAGANGPPAGGSRPGGGPLLPGGPGGAAGGADGPEGSIGVPPGGPGGFPGGSAGGPPSPPGPGGPAGPGGSGGPPPGGPGLGPRGSGGAPGFGAMPFSANRLGVSITNITDGTSNTFGVVEAGPPVPWTKPADIPYDPRKPLPELVGPFSNALHVGMIDGTAAALRRNIDATTFRHLIETNDGHPVPVLKTLRARRPAETPEEREALRKQVQQNQDYIREIDRLVKEYAELAGAANRTTGDLVQSEEQAEQLKAVAETLRGLNQKLRDELGRKPGGAVPATSAPHR